MDNLQLFFCLSIWLRNVQSCSDRPVFYGVKIKSRVEKEERELSSMCLMNLLIHNFTIFFFSSWVFFQDHSRISGLQWKGEDIPLTSPLHLYLLYRHLYISWVITAKSSRSAPHRYQTDSNWELLVSECKLLTTKLHSIKFHQLQETVVHLQVFYKNVSL